MDGSARSRPSWTSAWSRGVDFVEQINEAVGSCRLLIAVIGPRWASAQDAHGRRRLDDPADFIRIEVEAALRKADARVVPVLVQDATMPTAEELPPALADLARRNALDLSDARWRHDVDRLISAAERVLGSRAPAPEVDAEHPPTGVPADDDPGARPAGPSWFRRHSRLAIAAAVLPVLGVLAVLLAGGSSDGGSSESRLLEVIPANVQEAGCDRVQGKGFWMRREHGAVVQDNCRLRKSVLSEAVPGGDLTYGLFPSVGEARDFVENDFRFELGEKSQMSRPCSADATARLEADYRGGNAECYENEEGVFINWTYRDSAVAAQLYLNPGTSVEAAVEARAKVL